MTRGAITTELDPEASAPEQIDAVTRLIHKRVPEEHRTTVLHALFQTPRREQISPPRERDRKKA